MATAAGDMILGIIQDGTIHGTAHIGADLIGEWAGVDSTSVIHHGLTGAGAVTTVAITAVITVAITAVATVVTIVVTMAAITDTIIITASHLIAISMGEQHYLIRTDAMQAVIVRPDHDLTYRQTEACQRALLPTEAHRYAVTKRGAAHRYEEKALLHLRGREKA